MTSADWLRELVEATAASSAALMLVLLLRRPVGRLFGAGARYQLWTLVPCALLACWLPAPEAGGGMRVLVGSAGGAAPLAAGDVVQAAPALAGADALLLPWLAGVLLMAATLVLQQRRYLARVAAGAVEPDCLHPALPRWRRATAARAAPALVGAWRPWLLLPADFETRYTPPQRELVLLHEATHLRRGDALVNLALACARVLFWFNPLLHVAASRLRFDQELACDAAVLRARPRQRREYADAMLKTELSVHGLPLGCHWQLTHPMKERIAMLKHSATPVAIRRAGVLACVAVSLAGAAVAWAAQPPAASSTFIADRADMRTVREVGGKFRPPAYPSAAIAAGEQGTVVLEVLVRADGSAGEVHVAADRTDASERLRQAATDAVHNWSFNPRIEDGKAVDSWVHVPVNFSLNEADGSPPSYAQLVPVTYPERAREAGVEGFVVLEVAVGASGRPVRVEVVDEQPAGMFTDAAQVVDGWTFNPGTDSDGKAATTVVDVPIAFVLSDTGSATVPRREGWTLDTLEVRP